MENVCVCARVRRGVGRKTEQRQTGQGSHKASNIFSTSLGNTPPVSQSSFHFSAHIYLCDYHCFEPISRRQLPRFKITPDAAHSSPFHLKAAQHSFITVNIQLTTAALDFLGGSSFLALDLMPAAAPPLDPRFCAGACSS